jgi:hypothetical protein
LLGIDQFLTQQPGKYGVDKLMAKFKRYDYSQKVLIPVSLEEQLVPGSLEFAIHMLRVTDKLIRYSSSRKKSF